MGRTGLAAYNTIAVARSMEPDINVLVDPDATLLTEISSMADLVPRREDNSDELRGGKEEPDEIYNNGATAKASLKFPKGRPDAYAFVTGFGLGAVTTEAAGTTGYLHTITPISGDLGQTRSNPTTPVAMQYGQAVFKRLFQSMAVNSFKVGFKKDAWPELSAELVGTGKNAENVIKAAVTAAANATSLTLPGKVQGAEAEDRLDAIHQVTAVIAGVETPVTVTAVSDADPGVLTIEPPGSDTDDVEYAVLYVPEEADGWMSFPDRVLETPLRVSDLTIKVGGKWNGTGFVGGRAPGCEVESIEWSFSNDIKPEFCMGGDYRFAGRLVRDGRKQTLKLNQELRNFILSQNLKDNDSFGVEILCEGAEYEAGQKFMFRVIFPRVGVMANPLSVGQKRVAEAGDLKPLDHDTYGSVIVQVRNQVAKYVNP